MMDKEDRVQALMSGAVGLFGLPDTPATQQAAREMLDFMETVWRLDVDPGDWPATVLNSRRNDGIRS